MKWTVEKISALSHADRHRLYENAKARQAEELMRIIEGCRLPYSDPSGLKLDSPIGRAMRDLIFSEEGRSAAIQATEKGLPALAGVDPILEAELGDDYRRTYEATIQAGYLVAQMMGQSGYEKSGRQGRLEGCVAKRGEIYISAK